MPDRKICRACDRSFKPSSRHRNCQRCRASSRPRQPCKGCGAPIKMDSKHCKKCAHTGPNNRSWKGGRTYHKAGYMMVLAPDHPRAGKGRYVLEHILVMERRLGRYLLPEERVHHKNNVRTDNRSRNLELWSTSHPTGARVRDLVRWAKEILQRYA